LIGRTSSMPARRSGHCLCSRRSSAALLARQRPPRLAAGASRSHAQQLVLLVLSHAVCCSVSKLLDEGRDVNAPLTFLPERTPLEAAVHAGHLPLVQLLLQRGASPRHRTTEDHDALSLAVV